MGLVDISQLNAMEPAAFLETVNFLFETAPPLAQRLLLARPFASYAELIDHAEQKVIPFLSPEDRLATINAHPRIGASKATLSAQSLKEQGYQPPSATTASANTTAATAPADDEAVNSELMRLNEEYERTFGHRFVVFVNGRPRAQIVPVLLLRLRENSAETELALGLSEMMAIAKDRLKKSGFS